MILWLNHINTKKLNVSFERYNQNSDLENSNLILHPIRTLDI